jgi:hypothetical protein
MSSNSKIAKIDRREFLKNALLFSGAAIALTRGNWVNQAVACENPPADAADPEKAAAKTQKYAHKAADFKGTRKPTFAKDANCLNCNFFKPTKKGDAWGKCAMVGNKQVCKDGLCNMWAALPKKS